MAETSLGKLSIKIGADTAGVKRGLKDTSRDLNKVSRQLNQNERSWKSWSIRSVAATVALGLAVSKLSRMTVEYADSFQSLTNKLKIATDGTEELAEVTTKMFEMANENRGSINTTVDLYTKLERSTRELGFSSEKLIDITDIIGKAFVVGGATSKEMDGAIRQLGQSLSLGALRGEEFNSVAEQAPVIMEAMKSATGKNAGELRKLAATGAITSEILIKSISAYSDKIRGDFSKTQATYGGKMEIARNKAIEFVGANESIKSAVNAAGDSVVFLSENIDGLITTGQVAINIYGSLLVGAMSRAVSAKFASAAASRQAVLAQREELASTLALLKLKADELRARVVLSNQKIIGAQKSVVSAAGTDKESAATARLNLMTAQNAKLKNTLAATNVRVAVTQATLTAATNVATGAMARAAVAGNALKMALGGWVGIAITAALVAAQFIDWESDLEKQSRETADGINALRSATENLTQAQRDQSMAQAIAHQKEYTDAINVQQQAINDVAAAVTARGTSITPEETAQIKAASDKMVLLGDALKRAKKSADNMFGTGALTAYTKAQGVLIDLEASGRLAGFKKVIDAYKKKSRTEIQVAEDSFTKREEAFKAFSKGEIEAINNSKKSEEDKAAAILAINTQLDADLKELTIRSAEEIAAIKVKAKEKLDALEAASPEAKAKERLQKIVDSLKSEETLLAESYIKKQKQFTEDAEFLKLSEAEKKQVLLDMEAKFQEDMKALKSETEGTGFIEELTARNATELELEAMHYANQLALLAEDIAARGGLKESQYAHFEQLEDEHQKRVKKIQQDSARAQMSIITGTMGAMATALDGGGKKMQAIGKKIAIARAVLAGGQAAVDAWRSGMETGGPWAPVVAAAYTAASIARTAGMIQSIKGNSTPSRSGGVRTPALPSSSPASAAGAVGATQDVVPQNISINLEGQALLSADMFRSIIDGINEATGDGMTINVTGG